MFLLVSVRHVGAHPYGHQHGFSIQISINLGKTFLRISRYGIFFWPESWRGSLYIYLLSFSRFRTLSIERFWFLLWSILNGVTLKTSNSCCLSKRPHESLQLHFVPTCFTRWEHGDLWSTSSFWNNTVLQRNERQKLLSYSKKKPKDILRGQLPLYVPIEPVFVFQSVKPSVRKSTSTKFTS